MEGEYTAHQMFITKEANTHIGYRAKVIQEKERKQRYQQNDLGRSTLKRTDDG